MTPPTSYCVIGRALCHARGRQLGVPGTVIGRGVKTGGKVAQADIMIGGTEKNKITTSKNGLRASFARGWVDVPSPPPPTERAARSGDRATSPGKPRPRRVDPYRIVSSRSVAGRARRLASPPSVTASRTLAALPRPGGVTTEVAVAHGRGLRSALSHSLPKRCFPRRRCCACAPRSRSFVHTHVH